MQQLPIRVPVLNLEALCCSVSRSLAKMNCLKSQQFRWSKAHPKGLDSGLCCLSVVSCLLAVQQSQCHWALAFTPEWTHWFPAAQMRPVSTSGASDTCVSKACADGGWCSPRLACLCTVGYALLGGQEAWLLGLAKVSDFGFSTKEEGFLQREVWWTESSKCVSLHGQYGYLEWYGVKWGENIPLW